MTKEEKIKGLQAIVDKEHHLSNKHKEAKAELEKLMAEETQADTQPTPPQPSVKEAKPTNSKPSKPKEVEVEKGPSVDLDDVELDFEVDPTETYTFKLVKESTGRYILPKITDIWDEAKNQIRKIRYSQTESTPFLDSQKESSKLSTKEIQFNKGELRVSGKDLCLLKYLAVFDGNADKKQINPENQRYRNLYKIYREDLVLKVSRQLREKRVEAANVVSKADKNDLVDFLRSNFRFNPKSIGEASLEDSLYNEAYKYASSHPEIFIKDFNNVKHKYKSLAQRGFEERILSIKDGAVVWEATKAKVYKKDNPDVREDEALAKWGIAFKEGAEFFKELSLKLE